MRPQLNTIGTPSLLEVWWHCVHFTGQFVLIQKDPRNVYVCACECVKREKETRRGSQPFISGHPIHHSYLHDSSCMAATGTKQFAPLISTTVLQTIIKLLQKAIGTIPKVRHLKADASLREKKTQTAGNDLWISSLSKLTTRCYAIIGLLSYPTCLHSSRLTCIGTQNHLRHTSRCLLLARGQENWLHRSVMVIQQRSRPSLGAGHT